jgi:O-antigen ligase
VLGIHGLNPWNLLLAIVFFAWLTARGREKLTIDVPPHLFWLFSIFFVTIVISYVRLASGVGALHEYAELMGAEPPSQMYLFSEYIINCLKWVVPGILIMDGCRDEKRMKLALYTILAMYFLLAVQVIRWMPLAMLNSGDQLSERGLKILVNEVGYHRVNISMILAGASWAFYAARDLSHHYLIKLGMLGGAAVCLFALALTGGRMGLVTWGILGAIFSIWKWRKFLALGPAVLILIIATVPAARERLMQGFEGGEVQTNVRIEETLNIDSEGTHWYTVTSGRSFAWPFVIEKIGERPLVGYGRDAMKTTGVAANLWTNYGEAFPHPHNSYLQWVMDNGILGAIPVFALFWIIVRRSGSLFMDERDKSFVIVGGVCLSLTLAFLIAGIGSQTFYPREGAVGMWVAIGLVYRVYIQREKAGMAESLHGDRNLEPVPS